MLAARLRVELEKSKPRISELEVARDWELLQKTTAESDSTTLIRQAPRVETVRGNRP